MSHIRDLQKLRSSRPNNLKPNTNEQPKRADKLFPDADTLRLNLQKVLKLKKDQEGCYAETERKQHRRGLSVNGFMLFENRSDCQRQLCHSIVEQHSPSQVAKKLDRALQETGSSTVREYVSREENRDDFANRESQSRLLASQTTVHRGVFHLDIVVGKGGFGKVWKVQHKKSGRIYAMKEMLKAKIIQKKSVDSVMNEVSLLTKLKHPFLVNMSYAFQDRENLYLVMDYLNGGDLRYHIGKCRRFSESQCKFFIACIIVALEYLHSNNIIHRDIKPENLVLDDRGYVRLTDLGVSRKVREDNANDTSGTPGYMAPEVIRRRNHSFPADFFAIGVMVYEFMLGRRPYVGKNRQEIRQQILAKQARASLDDLPRGWSNEALDFVNRLLLRDAESRLGSSGIHEIKEHEWLRTIDWNRLESRQLKSPYVPIDIEENYEDYKGQISEDTVVENIEENNLILRDRKVQELFEGYYFDPAKSQKKTARSIMYPASNGPAGGNRRTFNWT